MHGNLKEIFYVSCLIAQGSNAEIETQLLLCGRFGDIPADKLHNALLLNEEIDKMLRTLKTSIQRKLTANS